MRGLGQSDPWWEELLAALAEEEDGAVGPSFVDEEEPLPLPPPPVAHHVRPMPLPAIERVQAVLHQEAAPAPAPRRAREPSPIKEEEPTQGEPTWAAPRRALLVPVELVLLLAHLAVLLVAPRLAAALVVGANHGGAEVPLAAASPSATITAATGKAVPRPPSPWTDLGAATMPAYPTQRGGCQLVPPGSTTSRSGAAGALLLAVLTLVMLFIPTPKGRR